ncbi:hypothetical protein BIFPSEUDO_03939 [Bifidobacterium pseudocatenulatum DSM 20438 = JCM 1200 = LMG 10505]|uniref:Uncharacterized protein n=1 Tax=Bifidobacterium pseudocatenulatum DSM 20438 = JCM 1200 = LMG 10505 TaxID=547043 RepID=C0BU57_BIFPS|nr:hypothetical protein BIFPSEUDO_03939 [Bifidobacterium pseudocatenulatum DSM 20438 = JCM 1200 = LMG 10505]
MVPLLSVPPAFLFSFRRIWGSLAVPPRGGGRVGRARFGIIGRSPPGAEHGTRSSEDAGAGL